MVCNKKLGVLFYEWLLFLLVFGNIFRYSEKGYEEQL